MSFLIINAAIGFPSGCLFYNKKVVAFHTKSLIYVGTRDRQPIDGEPMRTPSCLPPQIPSHQWLTTTLFFKWQISFLIPTSISHLLRLQGMKSEASLQEVD